MGYLWIKALHVIAIISWMAGMLYLFRLYVYHAMTEHDAVRAQLQVMETKLLRVITTPAMIVSLITGGWMLWLQPALLKQHFMHAKLTLVFGMMAMHGMGAAYRKRLAQDPRVRSHKFFRVMNEIPTLLMIGIVILIIVRPF